MFSHFDTMPECERDAHTHIQTHDGGIYHTGTNLVKTAYPSWMKLRVLVGTLNVMIYANFGDNQLRGLGVAEGGSNFPILCRVTSLLSLKHLVTTTTMCDWLFQQLIQQ